MKKKLIEITNEHNIVCDNPYCDYKAIHKPNVDINDYLNSYLNKPCPLCGENLLTQKDYDDSMRLLKVINWLNKWFSWVMLFIPNKKRKIVTTHVHNGINIKK